MSAPEKEPETGTRDSHAKLQFREYQQERSESRKAAAAYRDSFWTGVRSPIPRWPRSHFQRLATYFTSRCCCCCCCCGLAPRWATHPTPCCCCCYPVTPVTRFPRPGPSQSWQQGPVRAVAAPSLCPRVPDIIPVSVCLYLRTDICLDCACAHCFYVLKHTGHVFAR